MFDKKTFEELIRGVRARDSQAECKLTELFEPIIRQSVRRQLAKARLASFLDSMDISQMVLCSFFVRAAAGQYRLERSEDLKKLLLRMARNKVIDQARKCRLPCTNGIEGCDPEDGKLVASDSSPCEHAIKQELLQEIQDRLSPEERRLTTMRMKGIKWLMIARRLGGTAQSRRKQLARALHRIAGELGLDANDYP